MWRRLTGRVSTGSVRMGLIRQFELEADTGGTLTIRPLTAHLTHEDLQAVIENVHQAASASFQNICFDFSKVTQLVGPWGVHFALLIYLARGLSACVSLNGLRGQPAALARLFRASPAVRALVLNGTDIQSRSRLADVA